MLKLLSEAIEHRSGHTPTLSRGIVDSMPCIYVDCGHCSFSTVWMPDNTTDQIAKRWNHAHRP